MLTNQIEEARGDAEALERIYKQALRAGNETTFREAIARSAGEHPEDILLAAWSYRLGIKPVDEGREARWSGRHWWIAIAGSLILGSLYALVAGDKPPIPDPATANPSFWLGWSPLAALGVLTFLAVAQRSSQRARWYVMSGAVAIVLAAATAWFVWGRTDATRNLAAIHFPFVIWAAVGGGVVLGHPNVARQFSAYILKSMETILTSGIYLAAGMVFAALAVGMFAALGITFSQKVLQSVGAWGIGVIPIIAVASVYTPSRPPMEQDWMAGLARILRILTRLMLPLALGILAAYLFWFIPLYFWRPFIEREVLVVYNITIMAIIGLLLSVVPTPNERHPARYDLLLRWGVLATALLAFLLNAYALAAVASRTFEYGLTPNRYAVLGWNVVTLVILAVVTFRVWRAGRDRWADELRQSIGSVMVLPIAWGLCMLFSLPYL